MQLSSRRRDGISGTAANCNAAAVDYERNFSRQSLDDFAMAIYRCDKNAS